MRSTILPIISWLICADSMANPRILAMLVLMSIETTTANASVTSVSGTEIASMIAT